MVLIEQLEELDDPKSDLLSEIGAFSTNAADNCSRCKSKLAEMQLTHPNTFRACHTVMAFNIVASEFHHRVHAYQDDGFFDEDIVAGTDSWMHGRQRELLQFFFINPVIAKIPVLADSLRAHPIFYAFDGDSATPTTPVGIVAARGSVDGHEASNGHDDGAGVPQNMISPAAVRAHLAEQVAGGELGGHVEGGGVEASPATFLRARRDAAMAAGESVQTDNPLAAANVGATGRWSKGSTPAPAPAAAAFVPEEADL